MPDDSLKELSPLFFVQDCDCGRTDCDSVLFVMIKPRLIPVEGHPGEQASTVRFPIDYIQRLVDGLRMKALAKGMRIR